VGSSNGAYMVSDFALKQMIDFKNNVDRKLKFAAICVWMGGISVDQFKHAMNEYGQDIDMGDIKYNEVEKMNMVVNNELPSMLVMSGTLDNQLCFCADAYKCFKYLGFPNTEFVIHEGETHGYKSRYTKPIWEYFKSKRRLGDI